MICTFELYPKNLICRVLIFVSFVVTLVHQLICRVSIRYHRQFSLFTQIRVQEYAFSSAENEQLNAECLCERFLLFDVSVCDCDIEQAVTIYLTHRYDKHDTMCFLLSSHWVCIRHFITDLYSSKLNVFLYLRKHFA